jgi:hypothetical protein
MDGIRRKRLKHDANMVTPQRCQRIFRHAGDIKSGKVDPASCQAFKAGHDHQ